MNVTDSPAPIDPPADEDPLIEHLHEDEVRGRIHKIDSEMAK
jgi:hypothetical protein